MTDELREKLDIFFGDDDAEEAAVPALSPKTSPLESLKTIVLALDWEITDDDLQELLTELAAVAQIYQKDTIAVRFIQVIESIAKYIKTKKANAHPHTIKLLNSSFQNFTHIIETPNVSENEKKTLLLKTINEFKAVKETIARDKQPISPIESPRMETPVKSSPASPVEPARESVRPTIAAPSSAAPTDEGVQQGEADFSKMSPHAAFAYALQEIKQTMQSEFSALRAEIRLWRQGQ